MEKQWLHLWNPRVTEITPLNVFSPCCRVLYVIGRIDQYPGERRRANRLSGETTAFRFSDTKFTQVKSIVQIGVELTDDSGIFKLKITFNINLSTTGRLLQTNLYAFPWKYKLREFVKRWNHFPRSDHCSNCCNFSLDYVSILSGENWCLSQIWT